MPSQASLPAVGRRFRAAALRAHGVRKNVKQRGGRAPPGQKAGLPADLLAAISGGGEALLQPPSRVWESASARPTSGREWLLFQSVRVELWRYRFDLAARRIAFAWKAATAVAPAAGRRRGKKEPIH